MSLKDRLSKKSTVITEPNVELPEINLESKEISDLKEKICVLLDEKISATPIWTNYDEIQQRELIKQFVEVQLANKFSNIVLSKIEKEKLIKEIAQSAKGYGPLDLLLNDSDITYILVNGPKNIFVEKDGKFTKAEVSFKDNKHLMSIIERMVLKAGRTIDEKSPIADVRLPDGARVNAVIPPIAIENPSISIQKIKQNVDNIEKLLKLNSLSAEIAQTLSAAVNSKLNILIIGDKGVGKTSLLNSLANQIPDEERIITIEDCAELTFQKENVVRLEAKPLVNDSKTQIKLKNLLSAALKMRPDRIIIGECNGEEVFDMIQAINLGKQSFMTTLYAASTFDALTKLEKMVISSGGEISEQNVKAQLASSIDLIIQMENLSDYSRKISSVTEILGFKNNQIQLQEIFKLKKTDEDLNVYTSAGIIPKFINKLEKGIVPLEYFGKERKHTYVSLGKNLAIENKDSKLLAQQNTSIKNRFMQREK